MYICAHACMCVVLYLYMYTHKIISVQINGMRLMNYNSYKQLSILSIRQILSYFGEGKKKKKSSYDMLICIFWGVSPFDNFISDSLTKQVQREKHYIC